MPPVRAAIRNYLIFAVVFLLLIIFLPANRAFLDAYHLTSKQYHGLLFLAELPLLAVWFGAFLGYAKLEEYAFTLIGTKEGDAYARMSAGAKWLAFGIALPTIVFFVFSSFAGNHPAWQSAAIILSNYVGLALSLTAFLKMSEGTRKLRLTRKIHQPASAIRWLQLLFAVLGALYCLLIFRQLDLSSLGSTNNPYYLPVWLLVLTLIVPYLYAWFLGLLTAFDMWPVSRVSLQGIYHDDGHWAGRRHRGTYRHTVFSFDYSTRQALHRRQCARFPLYDVCTDYSGVRSIHIRHQPVEADRRGLTR
jgi:hypothetical protein